MVAHKYQLICRVNKNPKDFVLSHDKIVVNGVELTVDSCHKQDSIQFSFCVPNEAVAEEVWASFTREYESELGLELVTLVSELKKWRNVQSPYEFQLISLGGLDAYAPSC